jgi:hypothetical protein
MALNINVTTQTHNQQTEERYGKDEEIAQIQIMMEVAVEHFQR